MSKKVVVANSFFDDLDLNILSAESGAPADIAGFVDTGSYILNALYSGSLFKGMPNNKINVLAGEETTGKSFICLSILKYFLDNNPTGQGLIIESEGALTTQMLLDREIPINRVRISEVETVQQFKTTALKIVQNYIDLPENKKFPFIIILDSLGMLSTSKEIADVSSGKEVADMTRTREIKSAFRVLTLKLSKAKIPLLVTNHVYQTMGMFPTKEVAGGSGVKYSANSIIALSKSKEKDKDGAVTGAIIRCKVLKSRASKENSEGRILLSYSKGLDKYYGLLELAIKYGVFVQLATKIQLPDGTSVFKSKIISEPEKYFTEDILKKLDEFCKIEYTYGNFSEDVSDVEDLSDSD